MRLGIESMFSDFKSSVLFDIKKIQKNHIKRI